MNGLMTCSSMGGCYVYPSAPWQQDWALIAWPLAAVVVALIAATAFVTVRAIESRYWTEKQED